MGYKCLACGLFWSIIIFSFVILFLVLAIVFKPHMIAATVDSASLSQFALSSSTLAYDLAVNMTVRNPNTRGGLYYDDVQSLAFYKDQRFGYAELDAFYQGTQTSTKLSPEFRGTQLLQGDVSAAEFTAGGNFAVNVDLNANLRYKAWAFKLGGYKAKISCKLSVPAPGAANSSPFQPTDCQVRLEVEVQVQGD